MLYDLLNEESLLAAIEWKKRINNSVCLLNGDAIPVYLIGNKVDYTIRSTIRNTRSSVMLCWC